MSVYGNKNSSNFLASVLWQKQLTFGDSYNSMIEKFVLRVINTEKSQK